MQQVLKPLKISQPLSKTKLLKSKKKAVVFDLDGTILDTIGDIASAVNFALDTYGFEPRTKEEIISFIGNGSLMLIRRALGDENAEKNYNKCRVCGSTNIDRIQRITGYLVGTTSRWNSGKLAELQDRVTHD